MLITNFASGELSQNLNGRTDLQQYYQGAGKISNFEIIPTGGIQRRVGTKRIGELSAEARLIPFIIDKDNSYILEFVSGHIYVWNKNGKVLGTNNKQLEIKITTDGSPYTDLDHIRSLQYAQTYNKLILVHKDHAPVEIQYKDRKFTAGYMTFDFYADVNVDDDYGIVIKAVDSFPSMTVINGVPYCIDTGKYYPNGVYCTYQSRLWKYNVAETKWDPEGTTPTIDYDLFTGESERPGSVCFFNNRLFFAGTYKERQKVWASCTPDTKGSRYNKFATYQKYVTVNRVIKDADLHVFTCTIAVEDVNKTANTTTLRNLTQDLRNATTEAITSYFISNGNIPVGTKVLSVTENTMVINTALNITEDLEAQTCTIQLWRSADTASSDDYEFQVIENDITTSDCSFNFEIASAENDAIKWVTANNYLTIGTESSVWECPADITALNIRSVMNGKYGSDEQQALCIDTAVVFFAQGKYGIREHYWNNATEAFQTNNIAILSEHVLKESPAVDFDYSNNPYNRLHIVREDGIAVNLLYDKNNAIMAWNRTEHGKGSLINIAVTRGDRQNDLIFYEVKIGTKYYLETYDDNDKVYLDSWQLYDSKASYDEDIVLWNKTTGEVCGASDIPAGFITAGDVVYIGYKFTSDIISLPVVSNDPTGKKRITNLLVRFVESYWPTLKVDSLDDELFSGETPYSGIKNITFPGITDRDVRFRITANEPYAVNILAINAVVA